VIAIAPATPWPRGPLPELLAVVGAVVIVASCVLGARVTTSIAAFALSSRRAREATGFVTIVVIVLLAPIVV
jgi:ABC-2 type transport system permease protein